MMKVKADKEVIAKKYEEFFCDRVFIQNIKVNN
jgi:hypothetical protein